MVECAVCGGQDFAEVDGEFFCNVCQTQSQDLRVIEAEDEFVSLPSASVIRTKKKEKDSAPEPEVLPLPWTCDEAFAIVLSTQSGALIKLGVDENIKEVIFKLLTTYLSRVGSAFTEEMVKCPLRERDKWTGGVSIPRVKSLIRSRAGVKGMYDDGGKPDEDENVAIDVDNEDTDNGVSDSEEGVPASLQTLRQRPFYMRLGTTLAMCQIAALYTTDLVTCADIVDWVRKDVLPYNKVIDALPKYIELNAKDLCTFVPLKSITCQKLRAMTGKLLCELGVHRLPHIDIERLICRYVAELNLPVAINGMAAHFYRQTSMRALYELTAGSRQLPSYEAIAVAYIIIIIQLLFGLDDVTENTLTRLAKERQTSERLFIWSEWVEYIDHKLASRHTHSPLPETYDEVKTCDSSRFDGAVTRAMLHARTVGHPTKKINRPDSRTALQNCLRTLLIRSDSRLNAPVESELMYDTPQKTPRKPTPTVSFRHTSVSYITDIDKFKKSFTGSGGFSLLDDEDGDVEMTAALSADEPESVPKAYELYCIQWAEDTERSEAYTWLVEACCSLIGCDVADVEAIKERIELVFFLDYSSHTLKEMRAAWRKRLCTRRFFRTTHLEPQY